MKLDTGNPLPDNKVSITIGADVCPINAMERSFLDADRQQLLGDVLPAFMDSDLRIANLESPLIQEVSPIKKSGPVLGAKHDTIKGLAACSIDVLSLANNHIKDHGAKGIEETLKQSQLHQIDVVGAGMNLEDASQMLIKSIKGIRIAILSVADHEWSIAGPHEAGANPFDLIEIARTIQRNQEQYDILIVLVHGGNEYYQWPSPQLQNACRFLIEIGASAVICQHSHCIGSYEFFEQGLIVYGQGNFLFDYPGSDKNWREGLLVKLELSLNQDMAAKFIPFVQNQTRSGVQLMNEQQAEQVLAEFERRSTVLQDKLALESKWTDFCTKQQSDFIGKAIGLNKISRYLYKKGLLGKFLQNDSTMLNMHNMVRCSAHRERLLTILNEQYKEL